MKSFKQMTNLELWSRLKQVYYKHSREYNVKPAIIDLVHIRNAHIPKISYILNRLDQDPELSKKLRFYGAPSSMLDAGVTISGVRYRCFMLKED